MKTTNGWLSRFGIATAAISAALLIGWLGFAHRGDEAPYAAGPGMYGPAGCPMGGGRWGWGGPMMGAPGPGIQRPLDMEDVKEIARNYLARYGEHLQIAEIMEFADNFYVEVREKDTGIGAMELLVWRDGRVTPEPGPNMMWNRKYGHMAGMMGTGGYAAAMPISPEEALTIAQTYLDRAMPGTMVGDEADPFYGYYTIHVTKDGAIIGMLSVNGYTGQVWYHSWHGRFIGMEEEGTGS